MKNVKPLCFWAVSVLLVVMLVAGCAPAPTAPAAKGEIRIGDLTDLTGPQSLPCGQWTSMLQDMAKYLNEKGGIKGNPVTVISYDTRSEVPTHMAGYAKLKDLDKVTALLSYGSTGGAGFKAAVDADKMVCFETPEITVLLPCTNSYTFGVHPNYPLKARIVMQWIKSDWKGSTPPRIGLAMNDAIASWSTRKALEVTAAEYGWKIDPVTVSPLLATDVGSEAMKHVAAKEDYNISMMTGPSLAAYVANPNLRPGGVESKFPFTLIQATGALTTVTNLKLFGPRGIPAGIVFPENVPLWEETNIEGVQLAHEFLTKYHPDTDVERMGFASFYAQTDVVVLAEGISRAIDKVGYDKLNGTAIKEALETLKDYKVMGGLCSPITYTSSDHLGARACRMMTTKVGGFEVLTDWLSSEMPAEWLDINFWK